MYVKLFASILDSSIWSEDHATVRVWITMLAVAGPDGIVRASPSGLTRRANVTAFECKIALEKFEAPDLESKSQEYEGRRIERVEGGWQLLNYQKYREIRTEQQVRDAVRQQHRRDEGRLYFVQAGKGGDIKIGFSANPAIRIDEMQTGSPVRLMTLAVVTGTLQDERQLQLRFADLRCGKIGERGSEWFKPAPALLDYIAGLARDPSRDGRDESQEAEEEAEEEATTAPPADVIADLRQLLPEPYRSDYDATVRKHPSPESLARTILAVGPGGIHEVRGAMWDTVGRALQELLAAGASFTPVTLRAFVQRLLSDPDGVTSGPRRRMTSHERNEAVLAKEMESLRGNP